MYDSITPANFLLAGTCIRTALTQLRVNQIGEQSNIVYGVPQLVNSPDMLLCIAVIITPCHKTYVGVVIYRQNLQAGVHYS